MHMNPAHETAGRLPLGAAIVPTLVVLAAIAVSPAAADDPYADAPPYLAPVQPWVSVLPLATAGEWLPTPDGGSLLFRGIPDGIGITETGAGRYRLTVNHEIFEDQGGPAGPLPSGSRITAFSLERTAPGGDPVIVDASLFIQRVHERVLEDDQGDLYSTMASPPGWSKICSATLVDLRHGFDVPIHLTGEEEKTPRGFDNRGGTPFAIIDGDAYPLRRMAHARWENVVPMPSFGDTTAVLLLDDADPYGDGLFAQLYLYVGPRIEGSPNDLARNGLSTGRLHVFVSDDPAIDTEATFTEKGASITGRWVPMDGSASDIELEEASRDVGGFRFVRLEDGVFDPTDPSRFYFVSTGREKTVNPFGRTYRLDLDPDAPSAGATMTLLLDGSEGVVNPDNIGMNRHGEILIQEDPIYDLSELGLARDTTIWLYTPSTGGLVPVAQIDRASAIQHALGADPDNVNLGGDDRPGYWEPSGVVDAEFAYGRGAWFTTVQAHSLRIDPDHLTVQGGQLLFLRVLTDDFVGLPEGPGSPPVPLRAHPNPSRGPVTLEVTAKAVAQVEVFDVRGTRVTRLEPPRHLTRFRWDGTGADGMPVGSGPYFLRATLTDGSTASTRVRILR